jgi:hypothetical protein
VPKECDDEEDRAEYADDEGGPVAVLCNVSSVSTDCGHNHPALALKIVPSVRRFIFVHRFAM